MKFGGNDQQFGKMFKCISVYENVCVLLQISLLFVPKCRLVLVLVMTKCRRQQGIMWTNIDQGQWPGAPFTSMV